MVRLGVSKTSDIGSIPVIPANKNSAIGVIATHRLLRRCQSESDLVETVGFISAAIKGS